MTKEDVDPFVASYQNLITTNVMSGKLTLLEDM